MIRVRSGAGDGAAKATWGRPRKLPTLRYLRSSSTSLAVSQSRNSKIAVSIAPFSPLMMTDNPVFVLKSIGGVVCEASLSITVRRSPTSLEVGHIHLAPVVYDHSPTLRCSWWRRRLVSVGWSAPIPILLWLLSRKEFAGGNWDLKMNIPYSLPGALALGASLSTARAKIVQRQVLDNESVGRASKSSCNHWYERCAR